jgi:hypothetical protein
MRRDDITVSIVCLRYDVVNSDCSSGGSEREIDRRLGSSNPWEYPNFESLLNLWLLNARRQTQYSNEAIKIESKRVGYVRKLL